MSLFGGLPAPNAATGATARVRRVQTEEEMQEDEIAAELADLPDDEGMEDGGAPIPAARPVLAPRHVDLRRRPRAPSPSTSEGEEDEEEGEAGAAPQDAPLASELRRRPRATEQSEGSEGMEEGPQLFEGPVKRHRTGDVSGRHAGTQDNTQAAGASGASGTLTRDAGAPPGSAAGPDTAAAPAASDQVTAALKKITSHISNPSKFPKASPLLRQLLEGTSLGKEHRAAAFDAVAAALPLVPASAGAHLVDPLNRREVIKLMAAVEARAASNYFNRAERSQIADVYRTLALTRNEMQTDDSFMFSKVLSRVREAVDELPEHMGHPTAGGIEIGPSVLAQARSESEAYEYVLGGGTGTRPGGVPPAPAPAAPAPAPAPAPRPAAAKPPPTAEEDPFGLDKLISGGGKKVEDDDPFGLGSLMGEQQAQKKQAAAPLLPAPPKAPKPQEPTSCAWGPLELLAAKRRVVLDAVQHARTFHKHTWAQSAIELTAEHCYQHKTRFEPVQAKEIEELWAWVLSARAARKRGPTAKEINRDSTSFERARAEWSRVNVSARGKVGSQGDAKSSAWLG